MPARSGTLSFIPQTIVEEQNDRVAGSSQVEPQRHGLVGAK